MKDFISKITFGFLMAQLLPGVVVVCAITCTVKLDPGESTGTLQDMVVSISEEWFKSSFMTVAFLFISVATGMLIHGLNWTVLAWLENKKDPKIRSL